MFSFDQKCKNMEEGYLLGRRRQDERLRSYERDEGGGSTSDSYDRLQQTYVVLSLVVVVSVMLPAGP